MQIKPPSFNHAKTIVERLQKAGHTAYFAGGWVRDHVMGLNSFDIDIATSASVDEVATLFDKTIPVGAAFGISIVVIEGEPFEVAAFRKDLDYLDGRRPSKVVPTTPKEDASRRDFTINGLFYNPITDEILDYVGGIADLHQGIVRAIGDPEARFREDRLRMIRAVRYSARFNFPIDPLTEKAILLHAKELFPAVSVERIWQELVKMRHSPRFKEALLTLFRLKLLGSIFPSLEKLSLEEMEKTLAPLESFPETLPLSVTLLTLFPNFSEKEALNFAERFKLPGDEREALRLFFALKKAFLTRPPLFEWIKLYAKPFAPIILKALFQMEMSPSEAEKAFAPHAHLLEAKKSAILRAREGRTLLCAADLLSRGIKPGPALGELLKKAEHLSIEEDIEDKEILISKIFNS